MLDFDELRARYLDVLDCLAHARLRPVDELRVDPAARLLAACSDMHESVKNRLEKEQRALLLAVSDMEQSAAAAQMLQGESDGVRARALETAMAVCYMRPFTTSDLRVPDDYLPTSVDDEVVHSHLKTFRNKVYAHTDKDSGRKIRDFRIEIEGEIVQFKWEEGWMPFPRDNLPYVINLCERGRRTGMRIDAALIQRKRAVSNSRTSVPRRSFRPPPVAAFFLAVPANLPTCQPASVSPHQLRD